MKNKRNRSFHKHARRFRRHKSDHWVIAVAIVTLSAIAQFYLGYHTTIAQLGLEFTGASITHHFLWGD